MAVMASDSAVADTALLEKAQNVAGIDLVPLNGEVNGAAPHGDPSSEEPATNGANHDLQDATRPSHAWYEAGPLEAGIEKSASGDDVGDDGVGASSTAEEKVEDATISSTAVTSITEPAASVPEPRETTTEPTEIISESEATITEPPTTVTELSATIPEPPATITEPPAITAPVSEVRDEELPDALPVDPAQALADAEPEVIQAPHKPATSEKQVSEEAIPTSEDEKMDTTEDVTAASPPPNSDAQMLLDEPAGPIEPGVSQVVTTISDQAQETKIEQDVKHEHVPSTEQPSAGQVRPRDEDEEGEPAAKRAKVEHLDGGMAPHGPSADAPMSSAEVATSEAKTAEPAATSAGAATSAESAPATPANSDSASSKPASFDSAPLTTLQVKFLVEQIRKAKKIKSALAFLKPVDPIALNIPSYIDIIKTPMDLSTMDEKLKANKYASADDLMADFEVMVENAKTFNGSNHPIAQAGQSLRAYFVKCMKALPKRDAAPKSVEELKKTSPAPPKVSRPARNILPPPPPPPPPVAKSPTETKAAGFLNEHGMPIIRRDSSAQNDRPKREIHPPKRDLPASSSRPKKKKAQLELRFCENVMNELNKKKHATFAYPFMIPVDPVALNIPNYHRIIKKPMDFGTVGRNLKDGAYASAKEFYSDCKLVFTNCYKFNPTTDEVFRMGKTLEGIFEQEWAKKDGWIANNMPPSEPASEDEEEEEEQEEEAPDPEVLNIARMREIQEQIAALTSEAMALATQPQQKRASPKAKTKKVAAAKPKATPKSNTSSVPKAPKTKAPKPAKIKKLSMEQKREVSEGIQNLDEVKMRKAVAIIRAGVPALASVQDDELELDIDEIPDDVIYKLWEFVRSSAPKKEREPSPEYVDDEDDDNYQAKGASGAGARRRKNKPMKANEQEERIKQLTQRLQGRGESGASASPAPDHAETDDDASESSEEE